jgi:septum formation protein
MSRPFLVLASQSPRRRELLSLLDVPFQVIPSRAKERFGKGTPAAQAERLALLKASEVALRLKKRGFRSGWVLGADTIVAKGGKLLAKPRNPADAAKMLRLLSGAAHSVVTGLALLPLGDGKPRLAHETTKVSFRRLDDGEIAAYVATGEPMDKAGAYGIQGRAGAFVRRIEGDYFNVVGLPLARLSLLLKDLGA